MSKLSVALTSIQPLPASLSTAQVADLQLTVSDARSTVRRIQTGYTAQSQTNTSDQNAASDRKFPEVETLFAKLSDMLKERYRFDVFAPG